MSRIKTQPIRMKVQERGQITLPKQLREELGLNPGDIVIGTPDGSGGYRLRRFEPKTIYEMYERWGDHEPRTFDLVEAMIGRAEEDYATELASEYDE